MKKLMEETMTKSFVHSLGLDCSILLSPYFIMLFLISPIMRMAAKLFLFSDPLQDVLFVLIDCHADFTVEI